MNQALKTFKRIQGHGNLWFMSVLVFLLAFCASNLHAQNSVAAGTVVFVSGTATAISGQQQPSAQQLTKDSKVQQDDLITTAENSYLYIRMEDGALLVLRPGASLHIDQWQYDPAHPEKSRIKYTLNHGVSRYVSGKGSQAAKDRFRFNTPIAAIGVRGTDFTVLAQPELTQVAVRSGAIVLGPFDGTCKSESLGPCEGDSTAELQAFKNNIFLELRLGDKRPQFIQSSAQHGPDQSSPILGNEPVSQSSQSNTQELSQTETIQKGRVDELINAQAKEPLVNWGRWSQLSKAQAIVYISQLLNGHQLVAISPDYALARNNSVGMQLPDSGIGKFRLTEHDGLFREATGAVPQPTQASAGSLQIDFGLRKFQTELQLDHNGQSLQFQSSGTVDAGNLLQSTALNRTNRLQGVVGGMGADQAGYIYRSKLSSGAELSGATVWAR